MASDEACSRRCAVKFVMSSNHCSGRDESDVVIVAARNSSLGESMVTAVEESVALLEEVIRSFSGGIDAVATEECRIEVDEQRAAMPREDSA